MTGDFRHCRPVGWFQSSPGQKAGCNVPSGRPRCAGLEFSFNPHPARRPGATPKLQYGGSEFACGVSILTRPEGRVQHPRSDRILGAPGVDVVSILTRPEGRVQRPANCIRLRVHAVFQSSPGQKAGCHPRPDRIDAATPALFQSSPGQKAGCNSRALDRIRFATTVLRCFNPHPARRPGATRPWRSPPMTSFLAVSILTRPEGRVQRVRRQGPT